MLLKLVGGMFWGQSPEVRAFLAERSGVATVHDLHIWTLSSNRVALSAHLLVDDLARWPEVLAAARHQLAHQGIAHVTLQPEPTVFAVRWQARAGGAAQ